MHHHYADITARIAETPKWYDEHGTPRYCEFGPNETAYIYADECALVLIACQDCGTEFNVAMSRSKYQHYPHHDDSSLADNVRDGSLHYGDPPNTNCCAAGPTMNCHDLRVLQFWSKDDGIDWIRKPELEIDLHRNK